MTQYQFYFVDFEFASFENFKPISMGVYSDHLIYYHEFMHAFSEADCSTFVLDEVMPLLKNKVMYQDEAQLLAENYPANKDDCDQAVERLKPLTRPNAILIYDSHYDQMLLDRLFKSSGYQVKALFDINSMMSPVYEYEVDIQDAFDELMIQSQQDIHIKRLLECDKKLPLQAHHALYDAAMLKFTSDAMVAGQLQHK